MTGYRYFLFLCLFLAAVLLASVAFADSSGPLVGAPDDTDDIVTIELATDSSTPELRKRSRRPDPFQL